MSSTLASAVTALDGIQGRRKSLLFFSCGRTPPVWNYSLPADTLDLIGRHYGREAGFTLANRADVHIYPCDARGLRTGAVTADQRGNAWGRSLNANLIGDQLMFDEIAEATGGTAVTGSNDYAPAFARIVEDNSHYYLLGYRAPDRPKNGQFVSLNVKVKRDGLRVRARKGYFAK